MSQSESKGMSRRDLLRRGTAMGIAVGGVSTGAVRLDHGPVQEAEAIAPAVAAAGIGASAATGWVLRETEILGSDDPPEGLTADALEQFIYQTVRARKSNNASTFVDNQNIIDQLDQGAYSEGKSAAFESINDQNTEADVLQDAKDAVNEHFTTVQKNFLKSWNESTEELDTQLYAIDEHPDLSQGNVFAADLDDRSFENDWTVSFDNETVELANGEDFEIHTLSGSHDYGDFTRSWDWSITYKETADDTGEFSPVLTNDGTRYLKHEPWNDVYSDIEQAHSEVIEGIETWVEGVYGEVQSGEIDSSQLLSPSDRAEMTSEEEGFAQAQADLQTLNIPTDIEREAEIYFIDLDTTLYGQLAYNGDADLETGEIDPDELDSSVYLTYDLAQGSGLWTEYEEGLDGGVLTLTERPPSGYAFEIVTTEDEIATVSSDEFEQSGDNSDKWTADLSDQLEQSIVDFEIYLISEQGTQYETTRLDEPFEIVTFRDSEGEEYDTTSFESSEPQTDDNYISQEEWDEDRERYQELIEKYEDSQNDGIAIPGAGDILEGEANTFIGMVIVGVVAVVSIFSALNPLS